MGLLQSKSRTNPVRIIMVGLDAAGKTTILYQLQKSSKSELTPLPIIGFNIETLTYNDLNLNVWDVGGRTNTFRFFKYYYTDVGAVVFVVDSNDRETFPFAKEHLEKLLADVYKENQKPLPFLIFANKQDLPNAMSVSEISSELELDRQRTEVSAWNIQPCCAVTKDGIHDGLSWLSSELNKTD
mgnify:FL=1